MSLRRWVRAAALVIAAFAALPAAAFAQSDRTRIIAVSGNPAPDGDGVLAAGPANPHTFSPSTASIDNAGRVTFVAALSGTPGFPEGVGASGVFRGDGVAPLTQLARSGQPAPDGNGRFYYFYPPSINNAGHVAFEAVHTDTAGDLARGGVYRSDGVTLTEILRDREPVPDGNGVFFALNPIRHPALNDAGQVAFVTGVTGIDPGYSIIVRGDGAGVTPIVRAGQPAPDAPAEVIWRHGRPTMNAGGQVAFSARLYGGERIYRSDGSTLTPIARTFQASPDGNGFLSNLFEPTLNDVGQVVFQARLLRTLGGQLNDQAIFRTDGTTMTVIARENQSLPNGPMRLGEFDGRSGMAFNNRGQVAFRTTNGALYRGDGGPLVSIAREGQAVPAGNGYFAGLDVPALNDVGQVLFKGSLRGTDGGFDDNLGLFFYDDRYGLLEIARKGDAFLGDTIAWLDVAGSYSGEGAELALNDSGQVAYSFWLTDGRVGVAVWTVPEPASGLTVAVAAAALGLVRRPARRRAGRASESAASCRSGRRWF